MRLSDCSNARVEELARPIYLNIIRGSNRRDYSVFSRDFSKELLLRITPERFDNQCNEFLLLTSISEDFEYIGCIRRESAMSVLWKLKSTVLKGEFFGSITLEEVSNKIRVSGIAAN